MDEEEERIEGAVVRLVRYWYDETGIGYWEQVPGQTPGGDGSFENSGLTREEYDEIVAMADPFKLDEGETMTSEEQKAAADAMTAYINELYASVAAMPEGAERAEAATKNLMKLNVLYHNHTEFLTSYMEVVPGEDTDDTDNTDNTGSTDGTGNGGEPAAQAEGDAAAGGTGDGHRAGRRRGAGHLQRLGQRQPRPDHPRGRRDAGGREGRVAPRLDLHSGYAGGPHRPPRSVQGRPGHELPVPAADGRRRRWTVADDDEKFFDQNGYEYVPGAGFDRDRRERPLAVPGLRHRHRTRPRQRLRRLQGAVLLSRRNRELPG